MTTHVRELTREEGWALLEGEAQRSLKMNAKDFIKTWKAGRYGDPDEQPEAFSLALLLPFVGEDPWESFGMVTNG